MRKIRFVCLDWGDTLMVDDGPQDRPMWQWPQVKVVDGARELLAELAGHYPLCIASNASVSKRGEIERALARGELLPFITHIFCFSEIGAKKDTPAFWEAVTRSLGCTTREIVLLGDSLEQDVLGPTRHGVQAVWFNPRRAAVPPGIHAVERLVDFLPLLQSIRQAD